MTKQDYMKLIDKFLSNTDDLSLIEKLKSELETEIDSLESIKVANEELSNKVQELRDTNMKLFLKQGSTIKETEPETEVSEAEAFDELLKTAIFKEGN